MKQDTAGFAYSLPAPAGKAQCLIFVIPVAITLVFVLVAQRDYLLFHSLAETFSVVIAAGIFMVAWHSLRNADNHFPLFLGIAYLFVGILDIFHILAFKGMVGTDGGGFNRANQLWISARYVESLSLLLAPIFLNRSLRVILVFLTYGLIVLLLLGAFFIWDIFPPIFIEGSGVTRFYTANEYAICLILLAAFGVVLKKGKLFDEKVQRLLAFSIVFTIISELAFTLYGDIYVFYHMFGHLLKVVSFYLIYQVVIITGLERPREILFKKAKEQEKELQEARDRATSAEILAGFGHWQRNLRENISTWSQGTYHLFGLDNGQPAPTYEEFRETVHPSDRHMLDRSVKKCLVQGGPHEAIYRVIRAGGDERIIRSIARRQRDRAGNLVGIEGTVQDITEQENAEEGVRFLSEIVSHMNDGVTVVCADTNIILYANPKFERMFGYAQGELCGKHISIVNAPAERSPEATAAEINQILQEIDEWSGEVFNIRKDGTTFWCRAVISSFEHKQFGKVYITIQTDITRRKHVDTSLRQYADRLKVLNQMDREILASCTPSEIAETGITHLRKMISCDGACVLLFDLENRRSIPLVSRAEVKAPLYVDDTLAFQCDFFMESLLRGEAVTVHEVRHRTPCPIQVAMHGAGIESFLAVPLLVEKKLLGALCVFTMDKRDFPSKQRYIMDEVASSVALALQNARLLETVSLHRTQLQEFALRLTTAEEDERQRLARELHDEAGQDLTALGINLEILKNMPSDAQRPAVAARLHDSQLLVEKITKQTRAIMTDLRPPLLDDYGLGSALRWHGENVSRRTGIPVFVEGGDIPRLSPHKEISLFRVVQEAVLNAVKHARAGQIVIRLEIVNDHLHLQVSDNGIGFSPQERICREPTTGLGLIIIRERIEAIGGHLQLESSQGKGTMVFVEVPL